MIARLMGLTTLSPRRLQELMESGAVTVIDVNSRQSWLQARVPGARHLDPLAYRDGDLPADKSALLVFYCSNFLCRKAPNAARRAEGMGYGDVRVLSSGLSGWIDARLATACGEPRVGRCPRSPVEAESESHRAGEVRRGGLAQFRADEGLHLCGPGPA